MKKVNVFWNYWHRTKIKNVVYRVISRFKAEKTLEAKPRTSRSTMTTKREDRMIIIKMSLKDRFDIDTSISRAFCGQTGKPIARKTVCRRLNKDELVFGFHVANLWLQRKIKRFILSSPQSIFCGQSNNGIWFNLVVNLNSTCLDLMERGL